MDALECAGDGSYSELMVIIRAWSKVRPLGCNLIKPEPILSWPSLIHILESAP
jgi:hypothetical protein